MNSYYPFSILTSREIDLLHKCILGSVNDLLDDIFLKKLESCDFSFSKSEIDFLSDCVKSYRSSLNRRNDNLNIWIEPDLMLCDKLIGKLELCLSFSDELKYDEYIDYID